ncbi:hypothetical protein Q5752_006100 [Cryptotrichosporon argae]
MSDTATELATRTSLPSDSEDLCFPSLTPNAYPAPPRATDELAERTPSPSATPGAAERAAGPSTRAQSPPPLSPRILRRPALAALPPMPGASPLEIMAHDAVTRIALDLATGSTSRAKAADALLEEVCRARAWAGATDGLESNGPEVRLRTVEDWIQGAEQRLRRVEREVFGDEAVYVWVGGEEAAWMSVEEYEEQRQGNGKGKIKAAGETEGQGGGKGKGKASEDHGAEARIPVDRLADAVVAANVDEARLQQLELTLDLAGVAADDEAAPSAEA